MKYSYGFILFVFFFLSSVVVHSQPRTCPTCTPPNLIYAAQKSIDEATEVTYFRKRHLILEKGLRWANTCVENFPSESECVRLQKKINQLIQEKRHKTK